MAAEQIPPSSEYALLLERLAYLLEYHDVAAGHKNCDECNRLATVKIQILKPFR